MKEIILFFFTIIVTAILFYGRRQYQKRDKKKSSLRKLINELNINYKIGTAKQAWAEYDLHCQIYIEDVKDLIGNVLADKINDLYISLKSINTKTSRIRQGHWDANLLRTYYEDVGTEIKSILDEISQNTRISKT